MKSRQISLYQNNQYSNPLQAREDFFSPAVAKGDINDRI